MDMKTLHRNKVWAMFGLIITLLVQLTVGHAQESSSMALGVQLLPKPEKVMLRSGTFTLQPGARIYLKDSILSGVSIAFNAVFSRTSGWAIEEVFQPSAQVQIIMETSDDLQEEAYTLQIDEMGVHVTTGGLSGGYHALQTIRQLLPLTVESGRLNRSEDWTLPFADISDAPQYAWRGLMLDVSRHFFEADYLKKVIDQMALLKMNTLHLHLVDDQGWRLEIKKYPELTAKGAFRVDQEMIPWRERRMPAPGEEATYGGFYTQSEMKDLVAYALNRGISIVPEIEMPAHVMSAIAAYPWLSCRGEEIAVPSGSVWPITEIYCAGKDSTFEFLENVLLEVMDVFPSAFIHVGGDEATKVNWEVCEHCNRRMRDEGLTSVEQLQSYFMQRMEGFISSRGRRMIGWDEILEGGLAPGATVMSWRGIQGGFEASAMGHDVVMSPMTHCYFDFYQGDPENEPVAIGGFTPLKKVYEFEPVVDSMSTEQAKHVLGAQANLWSEFVPNAPHSEYMLFPRLAALAEVLWTPKGSRDWEDFAGSRIPVLLKRFELSGVNYARSMFDISMNTTLLTGTPGTLQLELTSEAPGSEIRYSLGDSSAMNHKYQAAVEIDSSTVVCAGVFRDNWLQGKMFRKEIDINKATGRTLEFDRSPNKPYTAKGGFTLLDGLRGSTSFGDGKWLGWLGNVEVTLDLGATLPVQKLVVGTMENQGPYIFLPVGIEVSVSEDGRLFRPVAKEVYPFRVQKTLRLMDLNVDLGSVKARFIKIKLVNKGKDERGNGSWMFIDELKVF